MRKLTTNDLFFLNRLLLFCFFHRIFGEEQRHVQCRPPEPGDGQPESEPVLEEHFRGVR